MKQAFARLFLSRLGGSPQLLIFHLFTESPDLVKPGSGRAIKQHTDQPPLGRFYKKFVFYDFVSHFFLSTFLARSSPRRRPLRLGLASDRSVTLANALHPRKGAAQGADIENRFLACHD